MRDDTAADWETPSPWGSHIGMDLTEWQADFARVELSLAAFTRNRHGAPHGGVHASLLDTAMGFAGCYTGDPARRQMCLTLNLSVNYLSRPQGSRLVAEARKTGGGRSTFFAEGKVLDVDGTVIATGTGVFRYRK
ncbi:PaaI family thioesterase [Marinovum algicola]|uniref:PaaI family thioesterase n=1 Tax=Marinovum algicola TaxID=42444 RepID=UPI0024B913C9|nr:PaaI family thioesterase [Marinovum algicola]